MSIIKVSKRTVGPTLAKGGNDKPSDNIIDDQFGGNPWEGGDGFVCDTAGCRTSPLRSVGGYSC